MEGLLILLRNYFQFSLKKLPELVKRCLEKIKDALGEAKDLIDGAKGQGQREPQRQRQRQRGWYSSCCDIFSHPDPDLSSKTSVWKARFDELLQELEMFFSISANTEQIVSSADCASRLVQPVPDSGFVGSGIQNARKQLQTWLAEPEARVIGVYGKGGVGKTSLLKIIFNAYKKKVSRFFDVLIWFTVSRNFEIEQLQSSIAEALNLSLEGTSAETRKIKLNASLKGKTFLLIMDNVDNIPSEIDLKIADDNRSKSLISSRSGEVGIKIADDNGSKFLISSRTKEAIGKMGAKDQLSLSVEPLSIGEGFELFKRGAFTNGVVPNEQIEATAKDIASLCKGLPLAINVVARAMSFKETEEEWNSASTFLIRTDRSTDSSRNQRTIDPEVYKLLRWSYNELPDPQLKLCFLNCATFLEDKEIVVETLLKMWDAEGLLKWTREPNLMDAGQHCINVLVSRCLVECVEIIVDDDYHSVEYLKIHEGLYDMAIQIGSRKQMQGEKCLFAAAQRQEDFPSEEDTKDCKRISVCYSPLHKLPEDLKCQKLESLVLASNILLKVVPEAFFSKVTHSLKVLDLSCTSVKALPTSICQLGQLEFLNFSGCSELVDLPSNIGELQNLKHLKLDACYRLRKIPASLCQLISLNTLILPLMDSVCAMSVEDLQSLSNLMELTTVVKAKINVSTMATWSEMRNLTLEYEHDADADRDAIVPQHVILQNMENMKKLQKFHLINYQGRSLPDSICEVQNLKRLRLRSCYHLKHLFESKSVDNSFPMLEKLILKNLLKLENIAGASGVWNKGSMSKLQLLVIINCSLLKNLPEGMELPNLKELHITMCNELIELDIGSGGFPMLEILTLDEANKLESIAGSSGTWKESTMSNLQILEFIDCPLLKRLPKGMEKLSNLKLKQINGELDWWQRIYWDDEKMKTTLSHLFRII